MPFLRLNLADLQPSLRRARRDLAMIYAETGDVDNTTRHLIEVLRHYPSEAWNWVLLGNLYAGGKDDPETGEKFVHTALKLNPRDPRALNSFATFTQDAGHSEEALELFNQAIATVLPEMDLELAALEQPREKIRALKQGMIQELLTGKRRLV